LVDRVTVVRGRKLRSRVPLMPGYVFLSGEIEDAYDAIATRRVCQVIRVADQAGLGDELEPIQAAPERGAAPEPRPLAAVRRRCRVEKGPFQGIEGVVSSRLAANRLALQVRMLGRGALLEIDADLLAVID